MKHSVDGLLTIWCYYIINSNFGLIEKGKAEPSHKLPTLYQVLNGTYRRRTGEGLTMKNTQFDAINQCMPISRTLGSARPNVLFYYLLLIT